jgi:hydroxypyruvate isomerase
MDPKRNSRRGFIQKAAVAMAAAVATPTLLNAQDEEGKRKKSAENGPFRLKYAPSIGMFSETVGSDDPIENIRFCNEQGFRAIFDNGLMGRPVEEQEKIASELAKLGMDMGPFVCRFWRDLVCNRRS